MTTLRRMTEAEFTSWLTHAIPEYAAENVASGLWTQEASEERSCAEHEGLLPLGLSSEGNHFFCIEAPSGQSVGMLWFAVQTKFGLPIAYVYKIEVAVENQRQGYARQAFMALDREVETMGLHGIALHVFGHNTGARALYEGLGFEPTNIHRFKRVRTAA
jgi:ribosomal protein S18 acetylase RimI-like enzyme